jgi:hypothetical protein
MKKILDGSNQVVAFVLDTADYIQHKEKVFFSDPDDSIQVGSLFFKKDAAVSPHLHKKRYIGTVAPMEVLIVVQGEAVAHIYDNNRNEIAIEVLHSGDVLVQRTGGHGFKFVTSDTLILEVKSGPYVDKSGDKELILQ